jgi:PAS domain S-box-containing protein
MDDRTLPQPRLRVGRTSPQDTPDGEWDEYLYGHELFEQTSECVFIIGLDFRYIAVNQQALNLLGYEEHDLVGRPVSDVMSQDDSLGHGSYAGDRSSLYERILKRKDGTLLPVEISTSVVYKDGSQPAYIQSIARDISERKTAEKTLKRHTQILSVISDAAASLLRSSNIEVKIPKVLESLGRAMDVSCCAVFEIDTFSDRPFVRVRHEWHRSEAAELDLSASVQPFIPEMLTFNNGCFSSIEMETPPAVQSDLMFVSVPINGNPGSRGFLGFFDVPDNLPWLSSELDAAQTAANLIGSALQRNRYEETIQLNEARNRIILDALPDLLIRIDIDGVILDYSTKPDHPLYIHRDLISGKKLSQTWPEEIVNQITGEENDGTFSTSHYVEEFRLPYSNGAYESRLYPISIDEALIVIRDITEQAKLNEMKSDFINRASHELRTPLTSAMLMTELIQEGGTPEELDEYWRTLKSELNRQKILIDRLLMAGRLESGMLKLEVRPMDLIPILEESMMAVKPIASKRRVTLSLTTSRTSVQILGDKSGLQQVFINLINNAAKFSPEEGSVNIRVSETEEEVLIEIVDNGVGIPQDAIAYLFERFYRAKNVTIAEIPGSGIGLYIVKSIVDELGGMIEVSSVIGQGTTFTLHLQRGDVTL